MYDINEMYEGWRIFFPLEGKIKNHDVVYIKIYQRLADFVVLLLQQLPATTLHTDA